jgi:hypothetical protein
MWTELKKQVDVGCGTRGLALGNFWGNFNRVYFLIYSTTFSLLFKHAAIR